MARYLLPLIVALALAFFPLSKEFFSLNQVQVQADVSEDCKNLDGKSYDDLERCIAELARLRSLSEAATAPLESQVENLEAQINSARAGINRAKTQAAETAAEITQREEDLAYHYVLFSNRIAASYKRARTYNPLVMLFASNDASQLTKTLAYQEAAQAQDDQIIRSISGEISQLNADKKQLEEDQQRLAALEKQLDAQAEFFQGEIDKAKAYQKQLSGQIAALSARQQEIINARSGSFSVSFNDVVGDSSTSLAAFRSNAPSGYFGIFSFGGYTHRNGMSQYGALGRVKQLGWDYEQILKYYYPGVELKKVDNPTIVVYGKNTYGQTFSDESYALEDYLKHIYEVPSSWPPAVLKAQAIAARSYAYGKSRICSGQSCQEFKREENSDNWKQAVKDTEGIIMTGGPGGYQYSSTTGGWNNYTGWDTTDGGGGSNFVEKTFENIAGSPWVYKAWYKDDFGEFNSKGSTCGRSSPWLSPEEMADIVNAAIALKTSGIDTSRITPVTTSCWGGNPYSMEELRNLVAGKGGINSATNASVSQGNGTTITVTINGVQLSGAEFKKAVALRAPGYVRIPQKPSFAFFNIEQK